MCQTGPAVILRFYNLGRNFTRRLPKSTKMGLPRILSTSLKICHWSLVLVNWVSQVSLIHQHTNSKERLSSSVLTKMIFSKPGTKMNFQNSNKSLLVSDRTLQL